MSDSGQTPEFAYQARARLADNLFILRKRAGYTQYELGDRALVFASRVGSIENGKVLAPLDTYIRLAGALGVTLEELVAGVTWTPFVADLSSECGYRVEFETDSGD